MIVAIASLKPRGDANDIEIEQTFERMRELVAQVPGFVSYKSYVADDGEEIELARFDSEVALETWRTLPEHLEAQRRGRHEWFDEYWVQICTPIREYRLVRGVGYSSEMPWASHATEPHVGDPVDERAARTGSDRNG